MADRRAAEVSRGEHYHPRRIAEWVADSLRRRILQGELRDGDALPRQEDLLAEFGVSRPSLRGAIGILETEGLVTVRRGNVGGAIVHAPSEHRAAYMMALVLEGRRAPLGDVAMALRYLEPTCAALCARRDDRALAVTPALRDADAQLVDAVEDGRVSALSPAARSFHEEIVERCGNETMILIVGSLDSLWWAHACAWAVRATDTGSYPDASEQRRTIAEHEEILRAIESGDDIAASNALVRHLETAHQFPMEDNDPTDIVDSVALLHDPFARHRDTRS